MNPPLPSLDSIFQSIVLATLAIGLPILVVLSIRFLWDRNLTLGRSKELEKLIWQLHRIASALEHQMNLSFPAIQPGTEEPRDIAYLQQLGAQPAAAPRVATRCCSRDAPRASACRPTSCGTAREFAAGHPGGPSSCAAAPRAFCRGAARWGQLDVRPLAPPR